jgi:hypothetical protein
VAELGYWDKIHSEKGHDVSWWQDEESLWLDVLQQTQLTSGSVADIGAGTSVFLKAVGRIGFSPLFANDISASALNLLRVQMGDATAPVYFFAASATDVNFPEPVDIWHDRAVFHFLTETSDQVAYKQALLRNTFAGSFAIIATFSANGPETCSGLPIQRWSIEELNSFFGPEFTPIWSDTRVHTTPWGSAQEFSIVVLQRAHGEMN